MTGTRVTRRPRLLPWRLGLAWGAFTLVLGLAALAAALASPAKAITERFLREDTVAGLAAAAFIALAMALPAFPLPRLRVSPRRIAVFGALAAAVIAVVGWRSVMLAYPLSMDEFMASFDAAIFRDGRLFASVPEAWRLLRVPIQPQFMMFAPDGASWASSYLPTNAMVLALFSRLGEPALAGAFWAVLGIAATYGVARKLWPERPDAAAVAAVLLATSSQGLLTAMTPYAMSAHLALNMTWLWLFMRGDAKGDAGALAVGFVACGLHQVVFHPIFVAPFILQLLISRRWGRAGLYILAYGAMGLFWLFYWKLALPSGEAAAAGGGAMGLGVWVERYNAVKANLKPSGLGVMARNLFRLVTWQNPLLPALAVMGVMPAMRVKGVLRSLVLGAALMTVIVTAIMPYQGHGWGYRYLHGFLGAFALVAALAWIRLTEAATPERRQALTAGFAAAAIFAMAALLPLRAVQAHRLLAPYARAEAAIRDTDAEVVAVDTKGLLFGADLVRNTPTLSNRPKVVDLMMLRTAQIEALCARHRVVVFDRSSGSGIPYGRYRAAVEKRLTDNRAAMSRLACGVERIVMP